MASREKISVAPLTGCPCCSLDDPAGGSLQVDPRLKLGCGFGWDSCRKATEMRCTVVRLGSSDWNRSQVLGAQVPSYDRFPFRGPDILRLYRNFFMLIQRLPPSERPDATFKLRNEFRSKRHLIGEKRIGREYHRGRQRYEAYKALLDERDVKSQGALRRGAGNHMTMQNTDAAWQLLKTRANGTVPNLRNVIPSKRAVVQCANWTPFIATPILGNNHSSR